MQLLITAVLCVILLTCVGIVFRAMIRTRRPVRSLLGSTLQGACALAAVNVTGLITGVSLGVNWLSAVCCALLGVPGIITLLLFNVILAL